MYKGEKKKTKKSLDIYTETVRKCVRVSVAGHVAAASATLTTTTTTPVQCYPFRKTMKMCLFLDINTTCKHSLSEYNYHGGNIKQVACIQWRLKDLWLNAI